MLLSLFCLFVGLSYVAVLIYWLLNLMERCRKKNLKTAEELWSDISGNNDDLTMLVTIIFAPITILIFCMCLLFLKLKDVILNFIIAASQVKISVTNESEESKDA